MSVAVTVEATWRMSRIEFNSQHKAPATVVGYSELLLEPKGGDAEVFDKETGGIMPGAPISRPLDDTTLNDTIEVDGKTIHFASVVACLNAFMEKWRIEDANLPSPKFMRPAPAPEPETEVGYVPHLQQQKID